MNAATTTTQCASIGVNVEAAQSSADRCTPQPSDRCDVVDVDIGLLPNVSMRPEESTGSIENCRPSTKGATKLLLSATPATAQTIKSNSKQSSLLSTIATTTLPPAMTTKVMAAIATATSHVNATNDCPNVQQKLINTREFNQINLKSSPSSSSADQLANNNKTTSNSSSNSKTNDSNNKNHHKSNNNSNHIDNCNNNNNITKLQTSNRQKLIRTTTPPNAINNMPTIAACTTTKTLTIADKTLSTHRLASFEFDDVAAPTENYQHSDCVPVRVECDSVAGGTDHIQQQTTTTITTTTTTNKTTTNAPPIDSSIDGVTTHARIEMNAQSNSPSHSPPSTLSLQQQQEQQVVAAADNNKLEDAPTVPFDADQRFGCAHYKRRAMFVTPCCNKFYKCRFCHDENETHHFDRKTLTELICSECNTRQQVQEQCEHCGTRFGKYTCLICNLFDDTDKKQYHCKACGICRIGGAENFFHCEVCDMCLPIRLKIDGHRCVENISRSHCPVCLGDIHTSRIPCHIPDCGHLLHKTCFDQLLNSGHYACPICQTSLIDMTALWEYLDRQAVSLPIPKKYENQRIHIFCNDCHKTSKTKFNFIGLKCLQCGAYNTTQDVKRRMSLVTDEPSSA